MLPRIRLRGKIYISDIAVSLCLNKVAVFLQKSDPILVKYGCHAELLRYLGNISRLKIYAVNYIQIQLIAEIIFRTSGSAHTAAVSEAIRHYRIQAERTNSSFHFQAFFQFVSCLIKMPFHGPLRDMKP